MRQDLSHSLWLCPEPAAEALLGGCIADLAAEGGMPAFAPHVTLLGDLQGPPGRTLEACRPLLPAQAVSASVTGIGRTGNFFMALFLDLALSPDLAGLREALAAHLGVVTGPFRPHLSLAYGAPPAIADADLAARLALARTGSTMTLDRLCLVASARAVAIDDWRILDCLEL
jgi:2'-5' RNA ligase